MTIFRYSMYSLQGEGQGVGVSHPSLALRREEPSIKDEWMEKINDVRWEKRELRLQKKLAI